MMDSSDIGHRQAREQSVIAGSANLGAFMPAVRDDLLYRDVEKGVGVVERILHSSTEEFSSRAFLLNCLLEYGIPIMSSGIFSPWIGAMNASGFGALQFPTEFIDFLRQLVTLDIKTAAEVGPYRGGSSYFMAAVLKRANPEASLTMIDIEDNLVGFDLFAKKLNLVKAMPKSSNDFADTAFDFVFIDGDHSFLGVVRDFAQLGKHARKAVAFHDIYAHEFDGLEGGTVRAWNDIKQHLRISHAVYEFCHSAERSLGIGMAVAAR
jgi:hypothetical protein